MQRLPKLPKQDYVPRRPKSLQLENLETRETPSVSIVFDYSYDSNGFFSDPTRRAELQRAANDLTDRITNNLSAITPTGGNTWTLKTFNPGNTSQFIELYNRSIAADTLLVFAGGGAGVYGGEAGLGGFGGYTAQGFSQDWFDTIRFRGNAGFSTWGGSVAFDPTANWSFTGTPANNQLDFYSVAVHELGHVLGFGTATQFKSLVNGDRFTGANATAQNGGSNPFLASTTDTAHWRQGTRSEAQTVSMQPIIVPGTVVPFTNLDYAALADIGWQVSGLTPTTPTNSGGNTISGGSVNTSAVTGTNTLMGDPVVVSGAPDGTFQVYNATTGVLSAVGPPVTPFAGFRGVIRTTTGDVNGDGIKDIIAVAGPGGGPKVAIFDGRTGGKISEFFAFEPQFVGGVFVATADFDGDGRDDIVVSADQGGGPRVRVFSGGDPSQELVSFFGIADASFRGGARVAAGDINGDGTPDLVVAAGFGGGPRIAVYDGKGIANRLANPYRIAGDFYAFEPILNNGAYVAVGDVDGDGFGDLIFGAGPGGGPRVRVASGKTFTQYGGDAALNTQIANYFAGDEFTQGGVRVAVADIDADGTDDVITGSGMDLNSQVRVTRGKSLVMSKGGNPAEQITNNLFGGSKFSDGLYVG